MKQDLRFRGGYCPSGQLSAIGGQPSAASLEPHTPSNNIGTQYRTKTREQKVRSRWLPAVLLVFIWQASSAQTAKQTDIPAGIAIGDTIPEWFWELELNVINHPDGETAFRMAEHRDRMLVLDFWNTACPPCVASVADWDAWQRVYLDAVKVLPIHLYGDNARALPFARKRGWQLPIALGNAADTALNRSFYSGKRFGQVWIRDGRLLALPRHKAVTEALVDAVVKGQAGVRIPMDTYLGHPATDPVDPADPSLGHSGDIGGQKR